MYKRQLLTNAAYRRRVIGGLEDRVALGPFWSWYDSISEEQRQQVIAPVMNKLRPFLLRPRLRAVLGQTRPAFALSEVFTERKILLVSLAKGTLGSEAAGLLGSLVFSQSLWRVRHRGEDEMMGGWPLGCGRRSFLEPRARSQSGARPEGPGSVASSTNPRF